MRVDGIGLIPDCTSCCVFIGIMVYVHCLLRGVSAVFFQTADASAIATTNDDRRSSMGVQLFVSLFGGQHDNGIHRDQVSIVTIVSPWYQYNLGYHGGGNMISLVTMVTAIRPTQSTW